MGALCSCCLPIDQYVKRRHWRKQLRYAIEMGDPTVDYQLRIILIGDTTVGKTCLLRYFTDGRSPEHADGKQVYDPTVGVDFFSRFITLQDGLRIKLQIWDTAGQERFRSITQSYYRNSCGVVVVFDISQRTTFEHVPTWIMEAKRSIAPHQPTLVLVGSKADRHRHRQVQADEAQQFADYYEMPYVECSAVSGDGVGELFERLCAVVVERIRRGVYEPDGRWEGVRRGCLTPQQLERDGPDAAGGARRGCC